MKTFIAVVASLLVNGGVLGGLTYSVQALQAPPLGEVLDRAAAGWRDAADARQCAAGRPFGRPCAVRRW